MEGTLTLSGGEITGKCSELALVGRCATRLASPRIASLFAMLAVSGRVAVLDFGAVVEILSEEEISASASASIQSCSQTAPCRLF